jgi:hypothetical protein
MSQIVLIEHGTGREVTDPREFDDVIYRYGNMRDATGLRRVLDLGLLDATRHADIPDYRFEAIERSLMWNGKDGVDQKLLEDWIAATVANRPVVAAKMLADAFNKSSTHETAGRAFRLLRAAGADLYQRIPGNDGYPKAGYGSRAKLAFRDCAPIINLWHTAVRSMVDDVVYGTTSPEEMMKMLGPVATFEGGGARKECNLFEYMAYGHHQGARFREALSMVDTDVPGVALALAGTATSLIVTHKLGRAGARHAPDIISKVAALITFGADMPRLEENLAELARRNKIDPDFGLYPLLAQVDRKLDESTGGVDTAGVYYHHFEQSVARMAGIGDFASERRSGIDINATNAQGETALHLAAHHGSYQMIENLLTGGADVNARTSNGELVDDYIQKYRKSLIPTLQPMILAARARQAISSTLERARTAAANHGGNAP